MDSVKNFFPPIYNKESKILILGSFPSVKSREAAFYYSHPQNRFWKVIAALTGEQIPSTIPEKKQLLLEHGIAIYDVIESCDIKGSSDSSITNVVPSNLSFVLEEAPIKHIYANGNKAFELFQKYNTSNIPNQIIKLPSTSPANAAFSLERLVNEWSVIKPFISIKMGNIPPEIVGALLNWYDYNARILPWREEATPYRVWISEIMLQQTRVEAVKPYYDRFMAELPTVNHLAQVDEERLMKLWEGLGYYNRARNLQKAARTIMEEFHGELPRDFHQLMSLSGIGEYTAGAIGSIAYGLNVPAVDGNVLRVITRLMASYDDILSAKVKKQITKKIQEILPEPRVGDFNQALMELGATICLPNGRPKCQECPWDTRCLAYKEDLINVIPVKTPKKSRKKEDRTILLLEHKGNIALRKREEKGLLAGLWEFPNILGHLTKEEISSQLDLWNIKAYSLEACESGKHIFSHIEWQMSGYKVNVKNKEKSTQDFVWVTKEELKKDYAVPAAFEIFKNVL